MAVMPFAEQIARQHMVHLLEGRYVSIRLSEILAIWKSTKTLILWPYIEQL